MIFNETAFEADKKEEVPEVTPIEETTKKIRFFRCTKCGDCCRRPGVVPLTVTEVNALVQEAAKSNITIKIEQQTDEKAKGNRLLKGSYRMRVDSVCPFLVEPIGHCSLEDKKLKPEHCAKYPFIPAVASGLIPWSQVEKDCEGVRESTKDKIGYTAEQLVKLVYRKGERTR